MKRTLWRLLLGFSVSLLCFCWNLRSCVPNVKRGGEWCQICRGSRCSRRLARMAIWRMVIKQENIDLIAHVLFGDHLVKIVCEQCIFWFHCIQIRKMDSGLLYKTLALRITSAHITHLSGLVALLVQTPLFLYCLGVACPFYLYSVRKTLYHSNIMSYSCTFSFQRAL